jgi:hypothetical protein
VLAGLEVVVDDLADKIPRCAFVHGCGLYANLFIQEGAFRVQYRAGPPGPARSLLTTA